MAKPKVRVRQATAEDAGTVYELIMALARHHDAEQYVLADRQSLTRDGFSTTPRFTVLLAETESDVAGFLSYTWNYSIWLGRGYMNIDDVYVDSQYRGNGIGEALMLRAKAICSNHGYSRIRWEVQDDNEAARRFYERLGARYSNKGIFRWDV